MFQHFPRSDNWKRASWNGDILEDANSYGAVRSFPCGGSRQPGTIDACYNPSGALRLDEEDAVGATYV